MKCEGMRRYGGIFTMGIPEWVPCKKPAVVMLKFIQDGKKEEMPACMECWQEALTHPNIKILSAVPLKKETKKKKGKKKEVNIGFYIDQN